MPINAIATGQVVEVPSQPVVESWWLAFVLDPFPESAGAPPAHACEVVCKSPDLVSVLGDIRACDVVTVTGEMVMETLAGPLEDDLSGVRVWIKASSVHVLPGPGPS
jgi:hypothetical protein